MQKYIPTANYVLAEQLTGEMVYRFKMNDTHGMHKFILDLIPLMYIEEGSDIVMVFTSSGYMPVKPGDFLVFAPDGSLRDVRDHRSFPKMFAPEMS